MAIEWLLDRFKTYGDAPAITYRNKTYTYYDLFYNINNLNNNLQIRSSLVFLNSDFNFTSISVLFSLLNRNKIVIPSIKPIKDDNCLLDFQISKIWFSNDDIYNLYLSNKPIENPILKDLVQRNRSGLIIFSSGSSGKPKGIIHDAELFLEKYKESRPSVTTLGFLLFDHIGGLSTLFYILANGGHFVCLENRNVDTVCKNIEKYNVDFLSTTPSFLKLLLVFGNKYDISSLKKIQYGTEVMELHVLDKLSRTYPNIKFKQTYGLSEFGIIKIVSKNIDPYIKIEDENVEYKIVDDILWLRSVNSMLGYLNENSPFDKDGWMNTGDRVEVDGQYIKILGRDSDLINNGGRKIYPSEIENLLMQISNVKDVSVFGEKNDLLGQIVVAYFNLIDPEDHFIRRAYQYCHQNLLQHQIPLKIKVVEENLFNERYKKVRTK